MEDNTKLWNKKLEDLTVADAVKINLAVPAIMVGGMAIVAGVSHGKTLVASKLRTIKDNRQSKKLTVVES